MFLGYFPDFKMFHFENSQKIAKCVFVSLLCLGTVISATIETAQRTEDDEDRGICGEEEDMSGVDENILRLDFFHFTTRKRYIWEDWTVPTVSPIDNGSSGSYSHTMLLVVLPIVMVAIMIGLACGIKKCSEADCCAVETESHSSLSAGAFTTVHPPPVGAHSRAQVNRPPTAFGDMRRDLFGELESNRDVSDSARVTISFANSTYASSSQIGRGPGNAVAEKPPDYSTVTLNDLVNPIRPAFPVVQKNNETPPPEYGKENPLFK